MTDANTAFVTRLLEEPIPDTKKELKRQLTALFGLINVILNERCRAQHKLASERERLRHPKDKDLTDFDRQTMLNGMVADAQLEYELLNGLEELLKLRAQTLISLVNSQR